MHDPFGLGETGVPRINPSDPAEQRAYERLRQLFEDRPEEVFFSRQLEVSLEDDFFHWVSNRALRRLAEEGVVRTERRALRAGGTITIYWQRSFRYYKRTATRLMNLVEEYADPNIGGALGLHGESMVLEGFARSRFVMHGREVREHAGRMWEESMHDVDFVFERDGVAYGIEVKNTLGYPPQDEIRLKTQMSRHLGLRPVIVARMLPRPWIEVLRRSGGFGLILKYQLCPWTHRELARRVATETGLPVDSPRALAEGTMARFLRWHRRNIVN
jgi:hypothetical protein